MKTILSVVILLTGCTTNIHFNVQPQNQPQEKRQCVLTWPNILPSGDLPAIVDHLSDEQLIVLLSRDIRRLRDVITNNRTEYQKLIEALNACGIEVLH